MQEGLFVLLIVIRIGHVPHPRGYTPGYKQTAPNGADPRNFPPLRSPHSYKLTARHSLFGTSSIAILFCPIYCRLYNLAFLMQNRHIKTKDIPLFCCPGVDNLGCLLNSASKISTYNKVNQDHTNVAFYT